MSDLHGCSLAETPEEKQEQVTLHFNFLLRLLCKRAQTLCPLYLLPPNSFSGLLCSGNIAEETTEKLAQHWDLVLQAEAASAAGEAVHSLKSIHWRLNTVHRVLMCLNQAAWKRGAPATEAAHVARLCVENIGDSALVENVHQIAKDSPLILLT